MGIIYVAKRLAELPLRTVMDSVMRVTFPAFSRLQNDTKVLKIALERTVFGIATLVFPLYIGMMFFIHPFMELFPKYQKWDGAILSFYFLCATSIAASLSTPLTNALNAIGKIRVTLAFMILWIVLTWILVVISVHFMGVHGFAFALMLISTTVTLVVFVMKRYVPFTFYRTIRFPFLAALGQAAVYAIGLSVLPHSLPVIVLIGMGGIISYAGIIWKTEQSTLRSLLGGMKRS
jgi:O-antigen/teichoic acid export membrane protein